MRLDVLRSIYMRHIVDCKTEASRKPVPLDERVAADLWMWKENLQDRGDCQSTRKSYKTYFLWVGLGCGLEIRERVRLFDAERRSPSQLNSRMLAA
jgi:hypothetical protein